MSPYQWRTNPAEIVIAYEERGKRNGAGSRFTAATHCVESLHYLADLDAYLGSTRYLGHNPDHADIAHARWAVNTCITAIDLCAAGLGRAYCGNEEKKEFSLGYFNPTRKKNRKKGIRAWICRSYCGRNKKNTDKTEIYRSKLPDAYRDWIDNILGDPLYKEIKSARDWLTHSRIPRHLTLNAGPPTRTRLKLSVGKKKIGVRDLIERSRDVATKHISDFLDLLPNL